jgi:hypothetical protein
MFILSKNKEIVEVEEMEPVPIKISEPTISNEVQNFINSPDGTLPIINEEDLNENNITITQTEDEIKHNLRNIRRKYLKKIFNEAIEKIENIYNESNIEDCEDDPEYVDEDDDNEDDEDDEDEDDEDDEDEDDEDDEEDEEDEDDENKYVISINNIPYFYFDSLNETRKKLQKISRKLLLNDSIEFSGYINRDPYNKNKLTVFRTLDFLFFKYNYAMYNIKIDVVGKPFF